MTPELASPPYEFLLDLGRTLGYLQGLVAYQSMRGSDSSEEMAEAFEKSLEESLRRLLGNRKNPDVDWPTLDLYVESACKRCLAMIEQKTPVPNLEDL